MINTKTLRRAIQAGDVNTVITILRENKSLNIILKQGWVPLHLAAKAGKREVVSALLEAGATINAETEMRQTAVDIAFESKHDALAKLLRSRGGKSAVELSLHAAVMAGNLDWVKKHLSAGQDINRQQNNELPLGIALARRHWDVSLLLLRKKCDVTKTQEWRTSPLHIACAAGAPDQILEKMLSLGANVNAMNDAGETPLCYAAGAGHQTIVDWLLAHGADVAQGKAERTTPVSRATGNNHSQLAFNLIERGAQSTLHQAVQCGHLGRARQKLMAGADPNKERDPCRAETPLEMAIWNDSSDMVGLLLEHGADPNYQDSSYRSQSDTPLHYAVCKGSAKMVKLLLSHGADCDIQNAEGLTPIELAKRRDRSHLVSLMETHLDRKMSIANTATPVEQLYTVQKVAELLSVDEGFVMKLIADKKIRHLNLDEKTLRIPAGSLQRFLTKLVK